MNLNLIRLYSDEDGIISALYDQNDDEVSVTLEHAYVCPEGWRPKIPDGVYVCRRGMHRLKGMKEDFETFEIIGVPGHTGLLFHCGNFNKDSEGCILTGQDAKNINGVIMVTNSKLAFKKFMDSQDGVDEFRLTVEET